MAVVCTVLCPCLEIHEHLIWYTKCGKQYNKLAVQITWHEDCMVADLKNPAVRLNFCHWWMRAECTTRKVWIKCQHSFTPPSWICSASVQLPVPGRSNSRPLAADWGPEVLPDMPPPAPGTLPPGSSRSPTQRGTPGQTASPRRNCWMQRYVFLQWLLTS